MTTLIIMAAVSLFALRATAAKIFPIASAPSAPPTDTGFAPPVGEGLGKDAGLDVGDTIRKIWCIVLPGASCPDTIEKLGMGKPSATQGSTRGGLTLY